uniref:Uncharacterized protein n=1 Tax=Cannabis sativa TaxID=3483 RepID=A0A803NKD5_CANSA
MDSSVENSKSSLPDCLIEDLESDEIPVGVPFEQVTLVLNPECDNINVGEIVIVNKEDPETIGYLIGPSDEGQDVCQDECSGEPTGFLNVNPEYGILHHDDQARMIKLGPTGVANNGVADTYKILEAMLFIWQNYHVLEKKNKKLTADNAFLKLENGKYVEKERELEKTIKSLKGELDKLKKELIDEKKGADDLA